MASKGTIEELRAAIQLIENGAAGFEVDHHDAPSQSGDTERLSSTNDDDDEYARAFAKISRIVSHAEKSTKQIRERLKRDGFSEEAIENSLERATRCGMVDDERYAEWLVRSRLRQGRGLAGIERELSEVGYRLEDLRGWPEEFEYNDDDETERAIAFLEKHPTNAKNKRDAAYRKLVMKGFSSQCSTRAARIWCERYSGE